MKAPDLTVPATLAAQAERYGSKPLIRSAAEVWSFAETLLYASQFAGALRDAGLDAGDRIALLCHSRLDIMRIWLGGGWAGTILVPINTALRGPQLRHVLADSGARVLVTEPEFLERLDALDDDVPTLERLWFAGDDGGSVTSWRGRPVEPLPHGGRSVDPHPSGPGDTLTILYTGGTTGPSKGVCCPHAQSHWWGRIAAAELGVGERDVLHTTLPLFHTNALHTLWQALVTGATFSFGGRFSASRFWTDLGASEATVTFLIGAMVKILLGRPPAPEERAHTVRIALAPGATAAEAEEFRRRCGIELVDAYGSTETNMITSTGIAGAHRDTMGRVLPQFEARVADDEDRPVPAGTPGELLLRHHVPFSFCTGYWGNAEQTVAAFRNLWFHTGDRVVADGDGCLRFVDRKKDAIRRRGENISSWEVEQVLLSHPDVAEAAVVPVPAELGEDEVLAFLVAADGGTIEPRSVIEHCEPRLAYFAVPRYIEVLAEFPRTEVGRVQKFKLRERGIGPATWDREGARAERG